MNLHGYDTLFQSGELEQVRVRACSVLEQQPANRGALLALAKLAAYEGREAEAEELLARATHGGGGADPDALLVLATLLIQRGDAMAAMDIYTQLTRRPQPRAEAFFGLGYLLAWSGDHPRARKALERAVQLTPEVGVYHFHLARSLFALEELKAGFQHLEKALRLNPHHLPTYMAWAAALQAGGQLEAAEGILRQGLEALPHNPPLLNELCNVLVARNRLPEAAAVAEEMAHQRPDDPVAVGNLARLRMAERRFDEALDLCRAMDMAGMATAQSWSVEAMVLEAREPPDFRGAIDAWTAVMALDQEDWAAANNLGNLLMRIPEKELPAASAQARVVLEEACRRAPERPEPVLNLAIACARMGARGLARKLARDLVSRAPAIAPALVDQAERLLKQLD